MTDPERLSCNILTKAQAAISILQYIPWASEPHYCTGLAEALLMRPRSPSVLGLTCARPREDELGSRGHRLRFRLHAVDCQLCTHASLY